MNVELLYSESTVLLILTAITFIGVWLDTNSKFFRQLGSAALIILMGMILSNTGVLPPESQMYDFFSGDGILAGIVLILLKINMDTLKDAGWPMIKAFLLGAFGSALGAFLMGYFLINQIGEETWKLSGQFAATYIGGGMNYAAIGRELNTSSDLFSAGIAADVLITAIWLIVCIVVPGLLEKNQQTSEPKDTPGMEEKPTENKKATLDQLLFKSARSISLNDIALMTLTVIAIIWISKLLSSFLPIVPMIIWLTTLALIMAQIPRIKKLSGTTVLGNYLILLFLATNGARSIISRIIEIGPGVLYFALGTVAIHGFIIFVIGRLLKIKPSMLAVASQANVGGAASAMAIAGARGYTSLVLSGVAVGILGNAIGNYIGLIIANLTQWFV